MRVGFKNYTVDIIDDLNYTLNSTDNVVSYDVEYFDDGMDADKFSPTSRHGIRVTREGERSASAIICGTGGVTTIHDNSFVFTNDSVLICCADNVYSLSLPGLQLNWRKRFDAATCFAIYPFKGDYIVHGELQLTRIDKDGNEKWSFAGRDIFVTPAGTDALELQSDRIKLKDWVGYEYLLDEDGQEIR